MRSNAIARVLGAIAICSLVSVLCFVSFVREAAAADDRYPTRVVQLVLPQSAGGAVDFVARALAPRLSGRLGQQVIVDNHPGANGGIAAEYVAHAIPDGHTLFMAVDSNLVVNPSLYSHLKYDAFRDFVPVSVIVRLYTVLVASQSLKADTVPQLIALAKAEPGVINYASVGYGSLQHLGMEFFKARAKINLTHIPYNGGAAAITDLLSGSVSLLLIGERTALEYFEKLKSLGITSPRRSPLLPQVATIAETLPGFELKAWFGILAPAKTPAAPRAILLRAIRDVVATADFRDLMAKQGIQVVGSTPEEMLALMKADSAMWAGLIQSIGAKID
jgi:tripartite-type tricarboxylate transporter receptor subunit TctC